MSTNLAQHFQNIRDGKFNTPKKATFKLQERIEWIKSSEYDNEWKERQIDGAIRTAERIEIRGHMEQLNSGNEYPYPTPNPNDLVELNTSWRENEYEKN